MLSAADADCAVGITGGSELALGSDDCPPDEEHEDNTLAMSAIANGLRVIDDLIQGNARRERSCSDEDETHVISRARSSVRVGDVNT
jgi:hypothetical protein